MSRRRSSRVIGLLLLVTGLAFGQLSPGPLAAPHDHLAGMTNCLNCHTWGSKDLAPKCLDCHTPIQSRIRDKQGFHGQLEKTNCVACHQDHLGEEFEMIRWESSKKDFDHDLTGYKLEGKHLKLECGECHKAALIKDEDILAYAKISKRENYLGTTLLGLGQACGDCHADVHKAEFKEQLCQDCHNTTDWKEAPKTFDHTRQTKYPLEGAHQQVDCQKCHKDLQQKVGKFQVHKFGGLKYEKCTDCHQDEHKGAFGQNCLECHTIKTFKVSSKSGTFDHEKSRFPLVGKHKQVKCAKCHTSKGQFERASSFNACSDCHEDYHKGVFAKENRDNSCDRCHSEEGFTPALFGMIKHQKTQFPLDGSHLALPCFACHGQKPDQKYRWDRMACDVCHETIHGQQFQQYRKAGNWCENCHKSQSWTQLTFDHKQTKFPLTGKHATASCQKCHKLEAGLVQYEGVATACSACHADVHAQQFAQSGCEHCHQTDAWTIARFDHNGLSRFALDGRHEKLLCGECHKYESQLKTIRFKPIPFACQDCHRFGESGP